jgi:hypothetical protein
MPILALVLGVGFQMLLAIWIERQQWERSKWVIKGTTITHLWHSFSVLTSLIINITIFPHIIVYKSDELWLFLLFGQSWFLAKGGSPSSTPKTDEWLTRTTSLPASAFSWASP